MEPVMSDLALWQVLVLWSAIWISFVVLWNTAILTMIRQAGRAWRDEK